jgi:tRNA (mo5U34)-methyltransferase
MVGRLVLAQVIGVRIPVPQPPSPVYDRAVRPDDPRLDGWYHTIDLGNGLITRGYFDLRPVLDRYGIPESLAGKTALDVGTGDGFFAFELERRGAEVVAIDVPNLGAADWTPQARARLGDGALKTGWPDHFRLAHELLRSRAEWRPRSVYDLDPSVDGVFDVVFCGSLLLHLQNPLAALTRIRSVTGEFAIIETAVDPGLEADGRPLASFGSPHEPAPGDANTFWLLTTAALRKMLVYAGFARSVALGTFDLSPTGPTGTAFIAYVDVGESP